MVEAGRVHVGIAEGSPLLYAEVIVEGGGHTGRAVLEHEHTNIVRIEKDGEVIFDAPCEAVTAEDVMAKFEDCYQFAETADFTRRERPASRGPFFLLRIITIAPKVSLTKASIRTILVTVHSIRVRTLRRASTFEACRPQTMLGIARSEQRASPNTTPFFFS